MSNTKHTPGPWAIGMRGGANSCVIYARDGADQFNDSGVAQIFGLYQNQPIENQRDATALANARLIAASPDLLAALEATMHYVPKDSAFTYPAARAAIAKAKGGAA